jgi:hypothetical protein
MIHNSAVFINTRLQPGAKRIALSKPFQRLPIKVKETVETVCSSFRWLHLAEARRK